jgi:hypothetical protein
MRTLLQEEGEGHLPALLQEGQGQTGPEARKPELGTRVVEQKPVEEHLRRVYPGRQKFWKDFVAVLEISKTGHVHLHAIVAGMYVPQQVLSRAAYERLGRPIVWINRAVPRKLGYLLKYIAKPPSFPSIRDYVRSLRLMYRFRRIRSFGRFYGACEDRPSLLLCRVCRWYLQFDCVEEDGWWKEEHMPLYGYDPPVKVVMIRGGAA